MAHKNHQSLKFKVLEKTFNSFYKDHLTTVFYETHYANDILLLDAGHNQSSY